MDRLRMTGQDEPQPLGRWGQSFLASLKNNDPAQYGELEEMGELDAVARDVDETATREYEGTLQALREKGPKGRTFADRVALEARAERMAAEIVQASVTVPNPEWAEQQTAGYTDENTSHWCEEPLLPKPAPRAAPAQPTMAPPIGPVTVEDMARMERMFMEGQRAELGLDRGPNFEAEVAQLREDVAKLK